MAKTSVSTIIDRIKRRIDYDITDSDLDTLLLDIVNDTMKLMKGWLTDAGIWEDITKDGEVQVIPGQEYRDPQAAVIVGDTTTFTGTAGDTLKVSIDGTDYDNIDIAASTDIDDVVSAINTAVGSTVAYNNATSTTLEIRSLTTGSSSTVTIADGSATAQTVVGDLFSDSNYRTNSAIYDLDDILTVYNPDNDQVVKVIPYTEFRLRYPDPTGDGQGNPDFCSRHYGRLYFGGYPTEAKLFKVGYVAHITELASTDTLSINNKYDPLVVAQSRLEYMMWKDEYNASTIATATAIRDKYKRELIDAAARRIGESQQALSRNETAFYGPRVPES